MTANFLKGIWLIFLVIAACSPLAAQSPALAEESVRARNFMAAGQYAAAIPLYRSLVRALPRNSGLITNLGMALHMAGHETQAVEELNAALTLDPANVPASLYLGYAYLSLGQPQRAVAPLERAVNAQPDDLDARENLGKALLASRQYALAAVQFERLLAVAPRNAAAWYRLGLSYQALSQQSYARLQQLAPASGYWLALAAAARAKAMQFSSAYYLYRQALEKLPKLRGAHAALAAIYRKTGHPDWARIEDARERQLGPPDCTEDALECDYAAGRYETIVHSRNQTPAALYSKSQAFDQLAVRAFSHLGESPNSPQYHELLASIHSAGGDAAGAAAEWQKAHVLVPNDAEVTEQLAMALIETKNFKEALPLVEQLRRQQPNSPGISYLLGHLLLSQQKPLKAIPALAEAVRRDPNLLRAQSSLAQAYLDTGQSVKAIPHLKAALPLDSDGSLHYQLARAYAAAGQRSLATSVLAEYQRIHTAYEQQAQELKQQVRVTAPPAR